MENITAFRQFSDIFMAILLLSFYEFLPIFFFFPYLISSALTFPLLVTYYSITFLFPTFHLLFSSLTFTLSLLLGVSQKYCLHLSNINRSFPIQILYRSVQITVGGWHSAFIRRATALNFLVSFLSFASSIPHSNVILWAFVISLSTHFLTFPSLLFVILLHCCKQNAQ